MKRRAESGFTLLEIIIVMVVLGVLVSLALPRMMSTVVKVKAAEAMQAFDAINSVMEGVRLYVFQDPLSFDMQDMGCGSVGYAPIAATSLGVSDPGAEPGAHFTYHVSCGLGGNWYYIEARSNGVGAPAYPPHAIKYLRGFGTPMPCPCGPENAPEGATICGLGDFASLGACP